MRLIPGNVKGLSKSSLCASAALAVGIFGLVVSACSGPGSAPASTSALLPQAQSFKPHASTSATPSPIPFKFQTVDDPNSGVNAVTGINQLSKIVGVYGGGQSSNIYRSYTSQPPYTKFTGINYNGSQGTYATSLSSNRIIAGYVIDPTSQNGILAFVRTNGIWTLLTDPNEGTGNDAVTEILGINDSDYAVGFYTNSSGIQMPFELDILSEAFTKLSPPGGGNAAATGINGKNDISGWQQTSNGIRGFFLKAGTYYQFWYPGAQATYATSLNWSDQVVGYYEDASGGWHGFLLIGPNKGGTAQVWQTIDDPNAAHGTWVTGINNHHDICGYYIDANNVQHGFVATP